jgi:hypothetical protein
MANRLANETSPYLQQHADNPVDWYPWGDEALEKARAEDKPIFLSIGYSACHWCHVMEHESFEDEETAAILNQYFVSIKVDREERPDLDRIYMSAVQSLTGRGGWPMSVFLTPDGKPFYGGTYFPPEPRHGMPSFKEVLYGVNEAWQNRRDEILEGSERIVTSIERQMSVGSADKSLERSTLDTAVRDLKRAFDPTHGGWGSAPKFPQPMVLEFILRYHQTTGDPELLEMATETLEAMARGGIYDQLGGGFHRYSVDDHWLVPHFEKMLYDNAQLARVYLHAWQVTDKPLFKAVTEETLDYVLREMTDPAGGFYSTQDADSEGQEGKFFLWTPSQVEEVLGDESARFMNLYALTEQGNFEGKNILTFSGNFEERAALSEARDRLFEAREQRVHPGRDEKVLTSWNGLMLAAFAEAAQALGREDYRAAAVRNANFLLEHIRTDDGRLLHTWKANPEPLAKGNGYLEDHTHLIEGLLVLYEATFKPRWYRAAHELAEQMIDHFSAPQGGFFDTSDDHETLVARPRTLQDNATPSGNAMATFVLPRLAQLAVEPRYQTLAERSLRQVQPMLARHPLGFGQWLTALDYVLAGSREIAIVGNPEASDALALLEACTDGYRPHQVVAVGQGEAVPLLRGRDSVDAQATAYVCENFTCRNPVTKPAELRTLLARS